ncbi:hypothetical protein [Alteromonas sp. H39]
MEYKELLIASVSISFWINVSFSQSRGVNADIGDGLGYTIRVLYQHIE